MSWPVAIAAVAIVVVAAERILAGPASRRLRWATWAAAAATIALCSTIALPGVLDADRPRRAPAQHPGGRRRAPRPAMTLVAVRAARGRPA